MKWVKKYGIQWYTDNKKNHYQPTKRIYIESLETHYRQILAWIRQRKIDFIFDDTRECNLDLVREFYANWFLEIHDNDV